MTTAKGSPLELGTEPIGKLLMRYAIPAIIAMTASSLYNIIDSIFIGHGVGALAISGLALTFPIMNLAAAFGSLVGVGASTLLSVRLGQRDYDSANQILGNVLILNVLIGISFTMLGLWLLDPILYFFGASDKTLPYAHDFMEVILWGNFITHMYLGLNAMLRSAGHPKESMFATIGTVLINAILAYIFIFIFKWGIKGAATATVIAQATMLIWQFRFFIQKKSFLRFTRQGLRLKRQIVSATISIGLSPFLINLAACLIAILINQGLKRYGNDLSIGAYGIVNRISFIFIMIVMGLNQGMQPIAGYNYGAKSYKRVIQVSKITMICATLVTTTGFLLGEFFPRQIASLFTTDETLIGLAVTGLRIIFIFYPVIGFQIVTSNFFQSIGMASKAIFLSLTRQMLFLVPGLLILPLFFGTSGIWWSIPIADVAATIVAGLLFQHQLRKFKKLEKSTLATQ